MAHTLASVPHRLQSGFAAALVMTLVGCSAQRDALAPRLDAAVVAATSSATYEVLPFDVPASMGTFTSVFGVNNEGTLTGNFAAPDGSAHGFVFRNGVFTDVVVPGSGPADHGSLADINELGTAVQGYSDADDVFHLALYDRQGRSMPVADPLPGALGADATGINDQGTIVGLVFDANGDQHGFVSGRGGVTIFDHPGGNRTRLFSINNRGAIVGQYFDAANRRHGFILDGGTLTAVDVPGSTGTAATGINNHGQIVGFYRTPDFSVHGFLLDHGQFTTIDFPGTSDTRLSAINDQGLITGTYDFFSRGMIAKPVRP